MTTKRERTERDPMQAIDSTVGQDPLCREETLAGIKRMSNGKATGPDGIPIEVYKACPVCKELLITLLQKNDYRKLNSS